MPPLRRKRKSALELFQSSEAIEGTAIVESPAPSAQPQFPSPQFELHCDFESSDDSRPSKMSKPSPNLSTPTNITSPEDLTPTEVPTTHDVVAFHSSLAEVHAAYQASRKQVVLVVEQFITDIKAFEDRFKPTDTKVLETAKAKLAYLSKEHERLDKLFTDAQAKVKAYEELQTVLTAYQQHHLSMFNCLGDPTIPRMVRECFDTQATMKMLLVRIKFEPLVQARDESWKRLTECVEKMDAQRKVIGEVEAEGETQACARRLLAVDRGIMDGVLSELNKKGEN